MAKTPACRGRVDDAAGARAAVAAIGFSMRTCLPAAIASSACSSVLAVRGRDVDDVHLRVGDELLVAAVRRSTPWSAAKAAARSAEREPAATTRWRGVPVQGGGEVGRDPAGREHAPEQGRCVVRVGMAGRGQRRERRAHGVTPPRRRTRHTGCGLETSGAWRAPATGAAQRTPLASTRRICGWKYTGYSWSPGLK